MASRMIHYAVACLAAREYRFADFDRFALGAMLPDAYAEGQKTAPAHLQVNVFDDAMKTYDLRRFASLFGDAMQRDDLYRGYYIHLVQDLHFRRFVYDKYHWNPLPEGNVARLHRDYALANAHVIQKYGLKKRLAVPQDFEKERIGELYPFGIDQFTRDFDADFAPVERGEPFFFTAQMADEFIEIALRETLAELRALDEGKFRTDMYAMAWRRGPR